MTAAQHFSAAQLRLRVGPSRCLDCGRACRIMRCAPCRAVFHDPTPYERYAARFRPRLLARSKAWRDRQRGP